jgi:hypothetical protein
MIEISLELNHNRVSEAVDSYIEWQKFEISNANVHMLDRGQILESLKSLPREPICGLSSLARSFGHCNTMKNPGISLKRPQNWKRYMV